MFLRLLFVLLSALNIAVGSWLWLGQPYPRGGIPSDAGVPELHLLSEVPDPSMSVGVSPPATAQAASVAPAEPEAPSYRCMTIGPFATPQDLHEVQRALVDQVQRMRSRQEREHQNGGWWVYLPAAASRARALQLARQLATHHINDYFVVSSGNQVNTISLGLFKDPANAHHRLDQVRSAGFAARMIERSEDVPEYWLDLVSQRADLSWQDVVHEPGVGSHSAACF